MDNRPIVLTDIEAEVYTADLKNDRCYVKITFVGLGLYINSFSVQRSIKHEGYCVLPPRHFQRPKGYTTTVDFDKQQPLWQIVEQRALKAAEKYRRDIASGNSKASVNNKDFNGSLGYKKNFF